jgi:hypothetical protein
LIGKERARLGTHIDAFFPHAIERSPEVVRSRLLTALSSLEAELALIRERGRFSAGSGDWFFSSDEGTITGEGPAGLSISVYPTVVRFTSVERFNAFERPDQGIDVALRQVFEVTAATFGAAGRLAVAAGGFGDADQAADIAFDGGGFTDVYACLEAVVGTPARSWVELESGLHGWYLSAPEPDPVSIRPEGHRVAKPYS